MCRLGMVLIELISIFRNISFFFTKLHKFSCLKQSYTLLCCSYIIYSNSLIHVVFLMAHHNYSLSMTSENNYMCLEQWKLYYQKLDYSHIVGHAIIFNYLWRIQKLVKHLRGNVLRKYWTAKSCWLFLQNAPS